MSVSQKDDDNIEAALPWEFRWIGEASASTAELDPVEASTVEAVPSSPCR